MRIPGVQALLNPKVQNPGTLLLLTRKRTQTHANAHAKTKKHVTTITRDEAVCALTRAMMVPELKGEEYEALLSVLPEEQGLVA